MPYRERVLGSPFSVLFGVRALDVRAGATRARAQSLVSIGSARASFVGGQAAVVIAIERVQRLGLRHFDAREHTVAIDVERGHNRIDDRDRRVRVRRRDLVGREGAVAIAIEAAEGDRCRCDFNVRDHTVVIGVERARNVRGHHRGCVNGGAARRAVLRGQRHHAETSDDTKRQGAGDDRGGTDSRADHR